MNDERELKGVALIKTSNGKYQASVGALKGIREGRELEVIKAAFQQGRDVERAELSAPSDRAAENDEGLHKRIEGYTEKIAEILDNTDPGIKRLDRLIALTGLCSDVHHAALAAARGNRAEIVAAAREVITSIKLSETSADIGLGHKVRYIVKGERVKAAFDVLAALVGDLNLRPVACKADELIAGAREMIGKCHKIIAIIGIRPADLEMAWKCFNEASRLVLEIRDALAALVEEVE